jgi:hypothetical protein
MASSESRLTDDDRVRVSLDFPSMVHAQLWLHRMESSGLMPVPTELNAMPTEDANLTDPETSIILKWESA